MIVHWLEENYNFQTYISSQFKLVRSLGTTIWKVVIKIAWNKQLHLYGDYSKHIKRSFLKYNELINLCFRILFINSKFKTDNKHMQGTSELLQPLLQLLNKIKPISSELEDILIKNFEPCNIKKGKILLYEGDVCKNLWFLADGLLRSYHNIGSKEVTSRIMFTNHVVIAPGSFFKQTPATESIEALSNCTVGILSNAKLQEIYNRFPEFNFHTRIITEDYFYKQEQRLYMLRKQNSTEKYKYFMKNYGEYLQQIPQKYIASFLNIARETFNRTRNLGNK